MSSVVKNRSESPYRWGILLFSCIMMIANYYCYDIPAALNSQMDDYFGNPSNYETMYSLLYTLYSIPNIILPFFGGYFVGQLGVRICLLVFTILITLGQLVVAIGLSSKSWPIMFIGRVIYGLGGENLGVANSAILSIWFEGKELAFAFGLNLSIARLGSVINNLVSPAIADSISIEFAMWFGVILCASSIFSVIVIGSIDKTVELLLGKEDDRKGLLNDTENAIESDHLIDNSKEGERTQSRTNSIVAAEISDIEINKISLRDVFTFGQIFWITTVTCVVVYGCVLPFNNIASALLLERDYFMTPPDECQLTDPTICQSDTNVPINCPSSKWYQPPIPNTFTTDDIDCNDSYYSDVCTVEYCNRLSDAQVQANTVMSIPYIISASLSPFLGGFVDRYGLRAVIATLSPMALVIVHAFLGYSDVSPIGPMVGQGLAYACFAAVIWPSVALIVESRVVGLAYGVIVSIQNFGLAVFPLIIASIYSSHDDQYIPSAEAFFIVLATLGAVIGFYLNYYDYYHMNNILNVPQAPKDQNSESRQNSDVKTNDF